MAPEISSTFRMNVAPGRRLTRYCPSSPDAESKKLSLHDVHGGSMRLNGPVMVILLAITASSARAGCLEEVAAFAERICGQIQTSGSSTLTEADGKLKA